MARLTQEDLEKKLKEKYAKEVNLNSNQKTELKAALETHVSNDKDHVKKEKLSDHQIKVMAADIMGEKKKGEYSIPYHDQQNESVLIPKVSTSEYPNISIKGQFPSNRQRRSSNLIILKEIDAILSKKVKGNRNAALNFLIWVGLETLKNSGTNDIAINVHSGTFADGRIVSEFQKIEELA